MVGSKIETRKTDSLRAHNWSTINQYPKWGVASKLDGWVNPVLYHIVDCKLAQHFVGWLGGGDIDVDHDGGEVAPC